MSKVKRLKVRFIDPDTRSVVSDVNIEDVYLHLNVSTNEIVAYVDTAVDKLDFELKEVEIQVIEDGSTE